MIDTGRNDRFDFVGRCWREPYATDCRVANLKTFRLRAARVSIRHSVQTQGRVSHRFRSATVNTASYPLPVLIVIVCGAKRVESSH